MSQEEQIKDLEAEVERLSSIIDKTKNYIFIGGPILIGAMTAFFGISYNKIGTEVDQTVSEYIKSETFSEAFAKVDEEGRKAIAQIETARDATTQRIDGIETELGQRRNAVMQDLPEIHQLMSRLSNYENLAEDKVKGIENKLEIAESIIPNLKEFSYHGSAKDGDAIPVPSGTVGDWSILVSPKHIGTDSGSDSQNLALVSADYTVRFDGTAAWKVFAKARYKFGRTVKTYQGEINYLIVPKGIQ